MPSSSIHGSWFMWALWACIALAFWLFIGIKFWWLFLNSYNYTDGYSRVESVIKEGREFMNATGYTFAEDKIKVLRWRRFIPISVIAVLIMPAIVIAAGITEFVDSL